MSAERPALRELARRLGVHDSYRDVGGHDRLTSDATREAIVAAMGFDASDERAAADRLEALERQARQRLVEPVQVWREWEGATPTLDVDAQCLDGATEYQIELRLEDGTRTSTEGSLPSAGPHGRIALPLPIPSPPFGYHESHLVVSGPGGERRAQQPFIMAPRTVLQPEEVLGETRAFGIAANLYSVRSEGGWGHGSLRELIRLGTFAGEVGAAFVGINPLHALTNRDLDFSPYSPSSRLYRNTLYIDPEAVPELGQSPAARALLDDANLRRRRAALESSAWIDHEAVLDAMHPVLRELHATFERSATPQRKEAYASYRQREGLALRDMATWEVLAAHHANPGDDASGTSWWRWPEHYRNPRNPEVEAFRREHAQEVDFRCWLQFELDRQLGAAADHLHRSGCALGIYQDFALGSSRASADMWMAPESFADGVHVGAPPDAYAPDGQDWGFPPFDPHRLRAEAYAPWSKLLRASFAHTGALRLDHAMGLLRLFWIPRGRPGSEGAYVGYDASDLLGVLALESRRRGAIVVAEDLGTLPPEIPGLLADWGLLRSAVVHFERDAGNVRPSAHYPPRALASIGTHDLAPLPGYFEGTDLAIRRATGGFESDDAWQAARAERQSERRSIVDALRTQGLLAEGDEPDDATLRDALHAYLAASPCVLASVALDDLAGEREPVNVPGIPLESHRSWSRRMTRSLDELTTSPEVRATLDPFEPRACRTARPR